METRTWRAARLFGRERAQPHQEPRGGSQAGRIGLHRAHPLGELEENVVSPRSLHSGGERLGRLAHRAACGSIGTRESEGGRANSSTSLSSTSMLPTSRIAILARRRSLGRSSPCRSIVCSAIFTAESGFLTSCARSEAEAREIGGSQRSRPILAVESERSRKQRDRAAGRAPQRHPRRELLRD